MPAAEPLAEGYLIALEEARRALDEQERTVAQLATRAGLLISAAAVVTSLLGGPVLAHSALDLAAWIAIIAFVGLAATALAILRPRRDWEFALHPVLLIGNYLEQQVGHPLAASTLRRELALNLGASVTRNEEALGRSRRSGCGSRTDPRLLHAPRQQPLHEEALEREEDEQRDRE